MNSQQPYLLPWQNMYGLNTLGGAQLLQQQQQQQLQLGKLGLQLPQQQIPSFSVNGTGLAFPGLQGMQALAGHPTLTMAGSQLYPIMSPQLAFPAPQPHQMGLQQTVLANHPSLPGLQKLFMPSIKVSGVHQT